MEPLTCTVNVRVNRWNSQTAANRQNSCKFMLQKQTTAFHFSNLSEHNITQHNISEHNITQCGDWQFWQGSGNQIHTLWTHQEKQACWSELWIGYTRHQHRLTPRGARKQTSSIWFTLPLLCCQRERGNRVCVIVNWERQCPAQGPPHITDVIRRVLLF